MTNVSKQELKSAHIQQLQKQLTDLFAVCNSKTAGELFNELFTESERVMYMKRLATIVMLDKGYSRYRISQTLKLSETTASDYALKYDEGHFAAILKLVSSKKFDREAFLKTLETVLQGGMPPMGKGRWKRALK